MKIKIPNRMLTNVRKHSKGSFNPDASTSSCHFHVKAHKEVQWMLNGVVEEGLESRKWSSGNETTGSDRKV